MEHAVDRTVVAATQGLGGRGLLVAVVALVALAVVWLFTSGRGEGPGRRVDEPDAGSRRGDRRPNQRDDDQDQDRDRGVAGTARGLSSRLRNQQGTLDDIHRTLGEMIRSPDLEPGVHRRLSRMYNQIDHLLFDARESTRAADELAQRLQR